MEITAEEAKKDPEVVSIEKIGANEKIWEVVILDNDGKQKTVILTKDELAEVDADKVVILNYIGKFPEPWWWRQYRNQPHHKEKALSLQEMQGHLYRG